MKKILLLIVVTFIVGKSFGQISSKMKLIYHDGYIEILDTAAIDTNYAPQIIPIEKGYTFIETEYDNKNGGLLIFLRNHTSGYKSYIELNAKKFNDFNNNNELRQWLLKGLNNGVNHRYDYDASDNMIEHRRYFLFSSDTVYSQEKDTLIYNASNKITDFKKVSDNSTW